jgi:hypothetical protein
MDRNGGFWSYVHDDDETEGGRIVRLAEDVKKQYEMMTAESIEIFLDRTSLTWGDDWRDKVDSSLASILFFVAILTPRYFLHPECRRELQTFVRRAEALGVKELILSVLYVDVPAIHEESPSDELVALVKPYQWEDWRDLRYEETSSSKYRHAVGELAQKLVNINQRLASRDVAIASVPETAPEPGDVPDADDEELCTLEIMARGEKALPEFAKAQNAIDSEINQITELLQSTNREFADSHITSYTGRLAIANRMAAALAPHAFKILELGNRYTTQLYDIDPAIRALIAQAPEMVNADPSSLPQICQVFTPIKTLSATTIASTAEMKSFIGKIGQGEALSRDLRPPLRELRTGISTIIEGNSMIIEWGRLVNESGIYCPE